MKATKYTPHIEAYIERSSEVMRAFKKQSHIISDIASALDKARARGASIFIMGNGGSASTASHMACDLNKTAIRSGKKRFRAVSLSDNIPVMLAWANDDSYGSIFEEQLKNHMSGGDIVIGISGSGNSENVLRAIKYANSKGNLTIGITGMGGGKLAGMAKLSLVIPDDTMYRIEDFHLALNHLLVYTFLHSD